ncbi:hypothetical protein BS78_05G230200 [Paspalum vaginatum]|nr:hypothetical protein BS78_05G230200 [Paspalum vaginatum]
MAAAKPLVAFLLCLVAAANASTSPSPDGGGHVPFTTLLPAEPAPTGCRGSVGECLAGDDGELGLHHHGRALSGSGGYISYGALRGDSVPCSHRGASYYSCHPGAQANPYRRGCSRITR